MRRLCGLVLLGSLVACEPAPTPIELVDEQIQLHSMLAAGDSIATVLVTRAKASDDDDFDAIISHPVTGAQIILSDGTSTFTFLPETRLMNRCVTYKLEAGFGQVTQPLSSRDSARNVALTPGCYVSAIAGNVRPGVTYSLIAEIPGGVTVRGSTTVPARPTIRSPESGATLALRLDENVPVPALRLAWSMSANTSHSEVALRLLRNECYGTLLSPALEDAYIRLPIIDRDSIDLRARWVQCNPPDAAATYDGELIVTVFDANHASQMLDRNRSANNTRAVSFGITGAAGTFAASATTRLPVVVRRLP